MLYIGHQVRPLLRRKRVPGRHIRAVQAPPDGVVQISVQRQSPGGSRAALEDSEGKVARFGVDPGRVLSLPVSQYTVAANTIPAVSALGIGGMTRQLADVALHSKSLVLLLFRHLRRAEAA